MIELWQVSLKIFLTRDSYIKVEFLLKDLTFYQVNLVWLLWIWEE